MCNQLILLAQQSQRHYLAQCEHGTLHLVWMHTTLHLNPQLMCELTDVLHAWAADEYDPAALETHLAEVRLEQAAFDSYNLWVEHTALRLSPAEVAMLHEMVSRADQLLRAMVVDVVQVAANMPAAESHFATLPVLQISNPAMPLADAGFCHELAVAAQRTYTPN
jgi:hypothetical protein